VAEASGLKAKWKQQHRLLDRLTRQTATRLYQHFGDVLPPRFAQLLQQFLAAWQQPSPHNEQVGQANESVWPPDHATLEQVHAP
jgi:hypothetical protein